MIIDETFWTKAERRMAKIELIFKENFYYVDKHSIIYHDFWDCPGYCEVKKK